MGYRAGIGYALARELGVAPGEPHIFCDNCGLRRTVKKNKNSYATANWLLNGKAAPGWAGGRQGNGKRLDYCPGCKGKHSGGGK